MPRKKGQTKCQVENREAVEGIQFNSRLMAEDLEILEVLLIQEMSRREFPSEALTHSMKLVSRIRGFNRENIGAVRILI